MVTAFRNVIMLGLLRNVYVASWGECFADYSGPMTMPRKRNAWYVDYRVGRLHAL